MFRLSYDNVDGFLRGIWKGSVAGDAYASIPSELLRKNPCDRSLGRISIVNFHREISASEYRSSTPIRWIFFENIMNFYSADNLGGHWISLRIISLGGGFIGSNLPGKFLPFSFVISLLSAIEKWSIDLSTFNTWIRYEITVNWTREILKFTVNKIVSSTRENRERKWTGERTLRSVSRVCWSRGNTESRQAHNDLDCRMTLHFTPVTGCPWKLCPSCDRRFSKGSR